MKITNGECFVIENGLKIAIDELRKSKVKNLLLNVTVSKNFKNISDICQLFRKDIAEFIPEELKELNEIKEDLTEEQKAKKDELTEKYNKEINEFLSQETEFEFIKVKIPQESLFGIEIDYDASNILSLILE